MIPSLCGIGGLASLLWSDDFVRLNKVTGREDHGPHSVERQFSRTSTDHTPRPSILKTHLRPSREMESEENTIDDEVIEVSVSTMKAHASIKLSSIVFFANLFHLSDRNRLIWFGELCAHAKRTCEYAFFIVTQLKEWGSLHRRTFPFDEMAYKFKDLQLIRWQRIHPSGASAIISADHGLA